MRSYPSKTSGRLLLVCAAALSIAARADAQGAAESRGASDPCLTDRACEELVAKGRLLSKSQQFEEALAAYNAAYERKPVPWLLVNIGRMQQRLGQHDAAIATYKRFLAKPRQANDEEAHDKVLSYLRSAESERAAQSSSAAPAATVSSGTASAPADPAAREPRPKWRIGLGAGALGVGLLLSGLGAGALSVDGQCKTPGDGPMGCALDMESGQAGVRVIRGTGAGAAMLSLGLALSGAGAVLIALPGKRVQSAPPVLQSSNP